MFVKRTGLDAVHVPFRGAAQTASGDARRRRQLCHRQSHLLSSRDQSSGKMRALAVTAAQRWPTMAVCRQWSRPA
jgi:tripartite-type tricarboxylate transporter receptor subunit TctC